MSLVFWAKCDDNVASTNVLDSSGNGYHGTAARNTDTIDAVGKVGGALTFNGTSDVVDCGSQLVGSGSFTIALWVLPHSLSALGAISQCGGPSPDVGDFVFRLPQDANGHVRLIRWNGTSTNFNAWISTSLHMVQNVWNHCVCVYNGTTVFLYLNGVGEEGTISISGYDTPATNTRIGIGITDYFDGLLDDVRIYNTALSANAISSIYAAGAGSDRAYPWQPRIVRETIRPTLMRQIA